MRLALIAVLCGFAAGCGDDADDGTDGGNHDASARDAHVPDARIATDAGSCPNVEQGWLVTGPAMRKSLAEVCGEGGCPKNWTEALANVGKGATDAGAVAGCYFTVTGCGVDTLVQTWGTHTRLWHFDHDTGQLIGAADQFTDLLQGSCDFIEIHAGRNDRPQCADLRQEKLLTPNCWSDADDAGR